MTIIRNISGKNDQMRKNRWKQNQIPKNVRLTIKKNKTQKNLETGNKNKRKLRREKQK